MIVTGRPTSRAPALAAYLARADWSQQAEVADLRGVAAGDLRGALCEMEAVALGATCRRPLYHASISPPPNAELTPGQWGQAVTRLEEGLHLTGQPRALVFHVKRGRRHLHVVWLRVHTDSMRVISCAYDRLTHRTVARQLEQGLGHAPPRSIAAMRQGAAPTWAELQQAERASIDLDSLSRILTRAWRADNVARAVGERSSMILARGDRGGPVVVDEEGGVYSVARRLGAAVSKTALRARVPTLGYLPSVAAARDEQYHYAAGRALGADLSRQDREEAEAPVLAAARAVLDRGLERLRACSTADANGDAGHQDSSMQRRHLARLAGRLALARQLVEALTDSPDGRPDLAQFVTLPDELLWRTGEDPELCVGPVWTLLERLRLAGVRIEGRAGPAQRHVATCPRAEIVAVLLGAGRPGSPVGYDLIDMLAEALPTSRRLGEIVTGTPDELSALCAMSRASDEKRARRRDARQQVARNAREAIGVAPDGEGDAGMVEWLLTNDEANGHSAGAPMSRLMAALRGQVPVAMEAVAEQPGQARLHGVRVPIAALVEHMHWLWEAARDAAEALLRLLREAASVTRRRDRGRRMLAQQAPEPESAGTPDAGAPPVRASGPGGGEGRSAPGDTTPVQVAAPGIPAARPPATTRVPRTDDADRAQEEAAWRVRDAQRRDERIAARAQREREALIAADPVLRAALAGLAAARPSPSAAAPAASEPQPRRGVNERLGGQPAPAAGPSSGPTHGRPAEPPWAASAPEMAAARAGTQPAGRPDPAQPARQHARAPVHPAPRQAAAASIGGPSGHLVQPVAAERPGAGSAPHASVAPAVTPAATLPGPGANLGRGRAQKGGPPSPCPAPSARQTRGQPGPVAPGGGVGRPGQATPSGAAAAMARLLAGAVVSVSQDGSAAVLFAPSNLLYGRGDDPHPGVAGLFGLWPALKALGVRPPGVDALDVRVREHRPPVRRVDVSLSRLADLLGALAPEAAEQWFARLRRAAAESRDHERGAPGDDVGPPAGTGQAPQPVPRAPTPARRRPRSDDDLER